MKWSSFRHQQKKALIFLSQSFLCLVNNKSVKSVTKINKAPTHVEGRITSQLTIMLIFRWQEFWVLGSAPSNLIILFSWHHFSQDSTTLVLEIINWCECVILRLNLICYWKSFKLWVNFSNFNSSSLRVKPKFPCSVEGIEVTFYCSCMNVQFECICINLFLIKGKCFPVQTWALWHFTYSLSNFSNRSVAFNKAVNWWWCLCASTPTTCNSNKCESLSGPCSSSLLRLTCNCYVFWFSKNLAMQR